MSGSGEGARPAAGTALGPGLGPGLEPGEFALIAARAGLVFRDAAEAERMRQGYLGLQRLLARLGDGEPRDEPAVVFAPPGVILAPGGDRR